MTLASTIGARGLYIDGRWTTGSGDERFEVLNPFTEAPIAHVPQATLADVDAAVGAARRAFDEGPWARTTPQERAQHLRALHAELAARRSDLAGLIVEEAGATRTNAEAMQVQVALDHLGDMAERVLATYPFERPMPPTIGATIAQGVIVQEPAGVVAAVTPFNYPLYINLSKLAPALAAGCTVVLRPSPYTPLAALALADAVDAAGFPPGVVNVVTGDLEASQRLTSHPGVDVVTFTGADTTGRSIMTQAAPGLKRVVLELGGKSADIVLEDAPLDRAAAHASRDFTRHAGQGCVCFTRILVHRSVHDELVERLVAELGTVRVGDPAQPDTEMGPLISDSQRARVEHLIGVGVDEGATVAFGGGRPAGLPTGYFVEPTLLVGVTSSMTVAQEEIFGPVAAVIPFDDDADAVRIANDSRYGLSGCVWSQDVPRAYRMARQIRTGTVMVNGPAGATNPHAPFGGYKDSGIGREFGEAGLEEYLETKSIKWPVGHG